MEASKRHCACYLLIYDRADNKNTHRKSNESTHKDVNMIILAYKAFTNVCRSAGYKFNLRTIAERPYKPSLERTKYKIRTLLTGDSSRISGGESGYAPDYSCYN